MRTIAVALAGMVIAAPALADVTVNDGDTLTVDGVTYRLWGIDAPEYSQVCADGFPAGAVASDVLRNLIYGKTIMCEPRPTERDRRTSVCRADGLDLSAMMVRAGWAWALVHYSSDYARQESEARAAKLGVHGHACQKPWDWRRKQGMEPSDFPQDASRWNLMGHEQRDD